MSLKSKKASPIRKRGANTVLSALLAFSLAIAPLSAFADEASEAPAEAETTASNSGESSSAVKHALHAVASQTIHSNDTPLSTTAEGACGLFVEKGATIIANALAVETKGDGAAAVATSAEGGSVSITNSQLATAGSGSPLMFSAGVVEADNVQGTAAKSALAVIEGAGSILVNSSSLASSGADSVNGTLPTSAVALYRTETIDASTDQVQTAFFQASKSSLDSAIDSGSFFYLTNTTATIVLQDNKLDFNSDKAKLLVAKGSDATSALTPSNNSTVFGTAGKNGATVSFTALDQSLSGNIEVDSISSVDFYLLDGSMWTGTSDVTANAAGADLATNITVNIDATSGWIVTEDATVSALNIAKGGKLVDADGKAVTIVDADGNKLVDGASDVKVSVTNEFSTTVKTSSANALQSATVDRTAFDEEFGTSTTFGTNGAGAAQSDEERAAELKAFIIDWFQNL